MTKAPAVVVDEDRVAHARSALEVEVTPPYLTDSYAVYRALRELDPEAIHFPQRGGLAYCSARAKQTGVAFRSTAIVIERAQSDSSSALTDGRPFLSKRVLGTMAAERLALELTGALADRPEPQLGERPLISVVVPFHERTAYLEHCFDGLARQTYPDLEVVVADDGSTSPDALRLLADLERRTWPWPLRIVRLAHGGLGSARNGGWRAASGELVLFVDDDDVAFDELAEMLWRARDLSGADVAVAGARFFRGIGAPSAQRGDVVRISLCEPRELGLISNQYGGPVNLWPRRILEQLGGFASVPNEDWDLLARATFAGVRITTPPDPLYWYRQTPGSMYSSDPAAFRDAGVPFISERFAEHLPAGLKLLPQLAAGAYSELERRKRSAQPRLQGRIRALVRRLRSRA